MSIRCHRSNRRGGIYIAVLATALITALLGMSAMIGQRLQNRAISSVADIRQAQLNANSAIELALLTMKQNTNWRTTFANGDWFVKRATVSGSCTVNVTDPVDANLADDPDESFAILAIGYSGAAEQRTKVTIDPRKEPLGCLRSAIAVGDAVSLSGDILRANNALISAGTVTASASQVYGKVEALSTSGSTYNGGTTTVTSEKRPTMPDWTAAFNYYRANGTQIDINSLPSQLPNMGKNIGIENGTNDWTGSPPGISSADVDQSNNQVRSGNYGLRVRNRAWNAGAAQYIDSFVKPGQQYTVSGYVYNPLSSGVRNYRFAIVTKGTGGTMQIDVSADTLALPLVWTQVTATLTAPSWSGNLEYAYVKIAGADTASTADFYLDDFTIREATTGRFLYRQVLSPSLNPFGGTTNAQGIYWINCGGERLVIERSRILGTLVVLNPGAGSCVANGPIHWSPAVAGYPALLVDADTPENADFALNCTYRGLSEKENGVNYNPASAPHDELGQDNDTSDTYRSMIRGLIAVRDDLTYTNRPLVRGNIVVGDDLGSSSGELEVDYVRDALLNPPPGFTSPYTYARRPASMEKAVVP